MIRWFDTITDEDFHLAGGKGFNLSMMHQSRLQVPNGFIILSTAYDSHIDTNGLGSKIDALLSGDNTGEISTAIQDLFVIDDMDISLKTDIMNAFKKIPSGRVAVRSSSTVEDLPGMSFAGQYSTYLNVTESDLLEKVVECWKSLWNERAIEYRKSNRIGSDFSHAVVIQEMVDAVVSGVLFTADPLTGLRNRVYVNASYGLGEAIVSGEVHPDSFTVDKSTAEILKQETGSKQFKYEYGTEGISKTDVPTDMQQKLSLSSEDLYKLVELGAIAEEYFKTPQDIEFSKDTEGRFHLLQSRDITTLFPIDKLDFDGKLRVYLGAGTVLLGMKEPFTPMGFDIMSYMFPTIINVMTARKRKLLTNNFVKYAGNRMYVDMSYLMASRMVSKQFANAFSGNDLPLKGVMYKVIEEYGKTLRHQGIRFRMPLGFMKYGFKMSMKTMKVIKIPNDKRYDAMIQVGDELYGKILDEFKRLDSMQDRIEFATHSLVEAFKLSQAQAIYCLDANNIGRIEKALKKHFGDKYTPEVLQQSLPRCFTQTMNVRLNEHAKYLVENNLSPSEENPEFQKILDTYGHRGNTELDIGTVRWREKPDYLLNLVASYMENGLYQRNLDDYEAKRKEALQMIDDIYEDMKSLKGEKKAAKFKASLLHYRTGAGMREYPKSDIVRFMELGRKALYDAGVELVEKGWIDKAEDIFFLHKAMIEEAVKTNHDNSLKKLVEDNRASYSREMNRNNIPRMLMNNGATYYSSTTLDPNSNSFEGMPLSPGVYTGKVRIVFDPTDTDLQEGEIMVTESTNPSWTPLFATAGALIMEYGGPISHGGIVAREYGIPAVVGISAVTSRLQDGQLVRVNGEAGTVEILDADKKPTNIT